MCVFSFRRGPLSQAAIARRAAKLAAQSAEAEKAAAQNAEDKVSNVPWVPADEEDPESAAVETSESSPKAVATDTPAASQADKSEKRYAAQQSCGIENVAVRGD